LEDQDVGGWTILKWILDRCDGMVLIGLIWVRIGTSGWLLIMQFSPTSCHFIPLRSKYSTQHPVLKHLQFVFLP
jgi:hypothetical protein